MVLLLVAVTVLLVLFLNLSYFVYQNLNHQLQSMTNRPNFQ